ncbi:hypothetical protein L1987_86312 [Smallanthus sonchifolius]|uniref:Uncharacterized protein n=1 Tax=Smallanthus sonchifolius TaxID=185202 RepID=A0ACB8Y0I9_9ASTR|nr:hypothetical protein L1987_86312 [Smallanthus sonchifolius]
MVSELSRLMCWLSNMGMANGIRSYGPDMVYWGYRPEPQGNSLSKEGEGEGEGEGEAERDNGEEIEWKKEREDVNNEVEVK